MWQRPERRNDAVGGAARPAERRPAAGRPVGLFPRAVSVSARCTYALDAAVRQLLVRAISTLAADEVAADEAVLALRLAELERVSVCIETGDADLIAGAAGRTAALSVRTAVQIARRQGSAAAALAGGAPEHARLPGAAPDREVDTLAVRAAARFAALRLPAGREAALSTLARARIAEAAAGLAAPGVAVRVVGKDLPTALRDLRPELLGARRALRARTSGRLRRELPARSVRSLDERVRQHRGEDRAAEQPHRAPARHRGRKRAGQIVDAQLATFMGCIFVPPASEVQACTGRRAPSSHSAEAPRLGCRFPASASSSRTGGRAPRASAGS